MRRALLWGTVAVLAAVMLVLAVPGTRRRAQLVYLQASGGIPDLAWDEMVMMLPPRSGYWIQPLVQSRNPHASIANPFRTPSDRTAGQRLFEERCSSCHGIDGTGDTGPDIVTVGLRQGVSDWALFRTIRHGIPGTAMQGVISSPRSVWQVVAHLQRLRAPQAGSPERGGRADLRLREVRFDDLRRAESDSASWLTYSGTYDGQRHSRLTQVARDNVEHLQIKWIAQVSPGTRDLVETTPLVVDSTMYLTAPPQEVLALDVRTGELRWSYSYDLPADMKLCCGRPNRGLAIHGATLYLGTLDAHLVALDARNGHVIWNVPVAENREGYSITGAPLALDGRIVVGVAGGEFGIRGFLDAYDAETGARLWRFWTVPAPGEAGADSWGGESWRTGGAPTWLTGTYDPELDLLYWGTGNPAPDFRGDERPGDNLFSNSVIAIEPETGRLRWHHQFTPHDEHDRDAVEIPVLTNLVLDGESKPVLLQANRNGFYYVLDRRNGDFIDATPFVHQTWADGIDSAGRPSVRPESAPTLRGTLVYPGVSGGTNWMSPSYNPEARLLYVAVREEGSVFRKSVEEPSLGEGQYLGSVGYVSSLGGRRTDLPQSFAIRALEAETGNLRWEFSPPQESNGKDFGGILSTSGDLVFAGSGNRFFALDAATGTELWRRNLGGQIWAAPITYMTEGRQQITVAAGSAIMTFSLDGR